MKPRHPTLDSCALFVTITKLKWTNEILTFEPWAFLHFLTLSERKTGSWILFWVYAILGLFWKEYSSSSVLVPERQHKNHSIFLQPVDTWTHDKQQQQPLPYIDTNKSAWDRGGSSAEENHGLCGAGSRISRMGRILVAAAYARFLSPFSWPINSPWTHAS